MSHGRLALAVCLLGVLVLTAVGCFLPIVEGVKAADVALEGEFDEIDPVAPGALDAYTGYTVGTCTWKPRSVPADTKPEDRKEIQRQIDEELDLAKKIVALLPSRYEEYMVDDAELTPGASPTLLISVADVWVDKRHGVVSVALPKCYVESIVTLADAATGKVLGTAKVHGDTSSRVLTTPRQLTNFICRGTGKWINAKR